MASNPAHQFPLQDPEVTNLRIIHPSTGPSIRTIGVGSGATSVVTAASYRFQEAHTVEGLCATLLDKHDDVAAEVVDSRPEPMTIIGDIAGIGRRRTTPDRARLLLSGTRQLVECKDDWAAFYRPDALVQAILGRAAAAALDWEYVQMVPSSICSKQARQTIDRIHPYGCVGPTMTAQTLARQMLAAGPIPLGELTAALHTGAANGLALACSMMVRRVVEIELDKPLGHNSLVRLAPDIPPGLPGIRFRPRRG